MENRAVNLNAVIDLLNMKLFGKDLFKALYELPPVTPRTGNWIKKKGGNDTYYYECSKCGCLSPHTECADSIIWKKSNYCPDCGARMEVNE